MSIRSLSSAGKRFFFVLVFSFFICPTSIYGAASIPSVAGPLTVTEKSYPFCAVARTIVPQDLSRLGYVEEEFLVSGKANIYDFDSAGKVAVKTPDAPYTTVQRYRSRDDLIFGRVK